MISAVKVTRYGKRLCLIVLGMACSVVIHAQETINISGTVVDNYGAMVQDAVVRIRGTALSGTTNTQGEYHLSGALTPEPTHGRYFSSVILDVSKDGYFPERRDLTSLAGTLDTITLRDDVIIPQPQSILSMDPPEAMQTAIILEKCDSANLAARFKTITDEWGMRVVQAPGPANCPKVRIAYGTKEEALNNSNEHGEQGYTLDITAAAEGIVINIISGDEAGAFYALQTFRRLIYTEDQMLYIRPAHIADWPAFQRRGLIIGYAAGSLLKTRSDFCSRLKLNLVVHCGLKGSEWNQDLQTQAASFKAFCDARYVECFALMGYQQALVDMGDAVTSYYNERFDAGLRCFTVNFDDIAISTLSDAQSLATAHATIANKICDDLRRRDTTVRFIFCPVPYGGLPSTNLVGAATPAIGVRYLNIIGESLPADMPLFWTGDGGVFSDTVTEAGAQEIYSATQGRKPFLWDNDAIHFANERQPMSGRGPQLCKYLSGYMANLNEQEVRWRPDKNVEFELITTAMYCWNPEKYAPAQAAQIAEQYLLPRSVPLGKIAVSASSGGEDWGWFPYCAVDGQCSSTPDSMGWSSSSSPTVNHSEWILLDFGTIRFLNGTDLYPRDDGANAGNGFPVDFSIATSTGDGSWNTVVTKSGYPQPVGTVQSFTFSPVNGRYMIITGTNLRPNPNDHNYYYMQFAEIKILPEREGRSSFRRVPLQRISRPR
jgi:hypothetical protein